MSENKKDLEIKVLQTQLNGAKDYINHLDLRKLQEDQKFHLRQEADKAWHNSVRITNIVNYILASTNIIIVLIMLWVASRIT